LHVIYSWRGFKEVLKPLKLFIIDGLLGLQDAAYVTFLRDCSDLVVLVKK